MIAFIVLAAVLSFAVVIAIVVPLLKKGSASELSPWAALAVAAVLVAGSAGLYAGWSNWSWSKAQAAADSPQTMVARLVRHLNSNPDDVEGWLLLGRSYVAMEQGPLAARAYERADRLAHGTNAEALIGLAEALTIEDDNALAGRAGQLVEQALRISSNSPKALFFGAAAAIHRQEYALARQRFTDLLALNPPANVVPIIQQQIAAIDEKLGTSAASPSPREAPAAAAGAVVRVTITLSPKIQIAADTGAPLFVFVREPGQPGPPLAVKRLVMRFPQTVELTALDAMVSGRAFKAGQSVQVVARIARSGSPTARSGDPFGQVDYKVGRDGIVNMVIDQLTP
ncbi:MAG TPA: hypothetical protein VLW26_12775 [Steroidobacteraceae bacterium]|nr:hypothetical protein [Steroidobacteraceae bacterium]